MTEAKRQIRCSDDARARGDRFVGTAPPAQRWFLVEQSGNWGASAWQGLDLNDEAKEALEELLEDAGARLMLIRRPAVAPHATQPDSGPGEAPTGAELLRERDEPVVGARRWCVVDAQAPHSVRWGRAADDDGLLMAARLFDDPGTPVPGVPVPARGFETRSALLSQREGEQPSSPPVPARGVETRSALLSEREGEQPSSPPVPELILVCTHGRKDVCCAVRGRPVAAQAARLWPEATWECTHTGGDRFAGNLIVLPDGACYGGLDPQDVEPIVTAHCAGRVDPEHLRGPSGHSPRVQAAMVAAYASFAPLAFADVSPVSATGAPDGWAVRLDVRGVGVVEVLGHTETSPPEFLTCKAEQRKVMRLPIVDRLRVVAPNPVGRGE